MFSREQIAGLATIASVKNLAAAPSETNEALAPQPTPMPGNELNTSDGGSDAVRRYARRWANAIKRSRA
jgi:hypothetical protein